MKTSSEYKCGLAGLRERQMILLNKAEDNSWVLLNLRPHRNVGAQLPVPVLEIVSPRTENGIAVGTDTRYIMEQLLLVSAVVEKTIEKMVRSNRVLPSLPSSDTSAFHHHHHYRLLPRSAIPFLLPTFSYYFFILLFQDIRHFISLPSGPSSWPRDDPREYQPVT